MNALCVGVKRVFDLLGLEWSAGVSVLVLVEDLLSVGKSNETLQLFHGWPGIWGVFAAVNEWTVTVTRTLRSSVRGA